MAHGGEVLDADCVRVVCAGVLSAYPDAKEADPGAVGVSVVSDVA